ncbi:hypothetical protein C8Q74DRAFT_938693 [Fomes fomentarius]|nr:hypothetical protein C8Q74DRAFT_938693 [Fomes fomentarius]
MERWVRCSSASFSAALSFMQAFHYFTHYIDDALHIKMLVAAVFIAETIHQALITQAHYTELRRIERNVVVEVFFEAITAFLVQSFYVSRIWRLYDRRLYIVIPIIALIVSQFAVSLVYTIKALALSTLDALDKLNAYAITMNATGAAADVAIAAIMCTLLHIHKSGFQRSNIIVNKLIFMTVETGLLTSTCACVALVTHLALRDSYVYICFFFLIGRLYSNSLFASLNARECLRDDLTVSASDFSDTQLHNMPPGPMKFAVPTGVVHLDASRAESSLEQVENTNPLMYHNNTKGPGAEVVIIGTSDKCNEG